MTAGTDLITAERQRQIEAKGYSPEHDAQHGTRRLIAAAQAYLLGDPSYLPWSMDEAALAKFLATPEREAITKAGALIAAALDVDPSATTDPQSASVSPEEALTVRCGTCDADPGEACVTVGPWPGRVQRYPHESRYGKAREARPSATTDGGEAAEALLGIVLAVAFAALLLWRLTS